MTARRVVPTVIRMPEVRRTGDQTARTRELREARRRPGPWPKAFALRGAAELADLRINLLLGSQPILEFRAWRETASLGTAVRGEPYALDPIIGGAHMSISHAARLVINVDDQVFCSANGCRTLSMIFGRGKQPSRRFAHDSLRSFELCQMALVEGNVAVDIRFHARSAGDDGAQQTVQIRVESKRQKAAQPPLKLFERICTWPPSSRLSTCCAPGHSAATKSSLGRGNSLARRTLFTD